MAVFILHFHLFIYLFICLFIYLFIYSFIHLLIYLFIHFLGGRVKVFFLNVLTTGIVPTAGTWT